MALKHREDSGTLPMLMPSDKPLLMIIDGHAQVHRAFHAISVRQHLTVGKTGEDVTAVYGFANAFLRAVQEWSPTHCAIAFDLPAPTFRSLRFPEYKAHRPSTPLELRHQFDRVKELMRAFKVPVFEQEGFEGDDVIGTLARSAEQQQIETVILTGDTDTFQLISPWVRVVLHSIQDRKVYGESEVRARFGGLTPDQQPDFKALKGDTSDNIPGVPSIGDKTAIKLVLEHGNIENMYENLDQIEPARVREALREHRDTAFLSKELATIVRDAPINLDLEECRFWRYDRKDIIELFRQFDFSNAIASRVPNPKQPTFADEPSPQVPGPDSTDYSVVDTKEKLEALVAELSGAEWFAFDTETTGLDPMKAELVGLSFSTAPGKGWYVPVAHQEGEQLPLEEVLPALRPVLESPSMGKTAHNANYDLTVLANHGVKVANVDFDTMVAAHLMGRKAIGLKNLALQVLDVEMEEITGLIGTGRKQITFDKTPIDRAAVYSAKDSDVTGRLRTFFDPQLKRAGIWELFTDVEMALVPVLVDMQRNGIGLNVGSLHEMSRDLAQHLRRVEQAIYDSVGHTVNINSPQQLSDLLFNELQLPKTKRTKTGGYTTDAGALEGLRGAHPVIDGVLEYRQLSKIKSTYVDSLPELINPRTGRIHTSYNQTGSSTGRVSSSDPNLQNIPVRTELGRQVRRAFVAENVPEWTLVSADYSQIELRVLAHLSQDAALLEAFNRGEDIHSATGALMYDVPIENITSDMRRISKVLNFGVIYGLSPFGISQQTEFSPDEGQKFIDNYFSKYPGIRDYLDSVKQQAREDGYVSTPLGRRRYIPEIHASNFNVRQGAERAAVNMPIQGGAADIMKLAMIRVHKKLNESGLRTRLLLQVHDELMFEAPMDEVDAVTDLALEEMSNAMDMSVPLKVDVKTGHNWGDLEQAG